MPIFKKRSPTKHTKQIVQIFFPRYPNIQNLVHTASLESAASFGIGHAHLRLEFFFRKIAKTAKLYFRYSSHIS